MARPPRLDQRSGPDDRLRCAGPVDPVRRPSITRSVALKTLERAGLTWRIVCTSGSLSGLRAACLAGLGATVHARGPIPEGLAELPPTAGLPELGDVEFVVLEARTGLRGPAAALAQTILANGSRLQRPARTNPGAAFPYR